MKGWPSTGVRFVLGKMGSGKTLFCMHILIQRLRAGRTVVTNLPVVLSGLKRCLDEYPEVVDVDRQLRILGDAHGGESVTEDMVEFWRYRGWKEGVGWVTLPAWCKETGVTDFTDNPGPVDYMIDEVHQLWPARSWNKTGLGVTWYTRQHRKYGDSVWFITHSETDVDKLLRVGVAEWVYLQNNRVENLAGIFRGVPWFTWGAWTSARSSYGQNPPPANLSGRFRLDVAGVCQAYDTSAGVGVVGGEAADKGARARGLPLWTLVIPFAAVMAGAWYLPDVIARGFIETKLSEKPVAVATNGTVREALHASPGVVHARPDREVAVDREGALAAQVGDAEKPAWLTCCVWTGAGWVVGLSDGREYGVGDPRVQGVWRDRVRIEGKDYQWHRKD